VVTFLLALPPISNIYIGLFFFTCANRRHKSREKRTKTFLWIFNGHYVLYMWFRNTQMRWGEVPRVLISADSLSTNEIHVFTSNYVLTIAPEAPKFVIKRQPKVKPLHPILSIPVNRKCSSARGCRLLSGCTVTAGTWVDLRASYTYSKP
jgi:hypothetical protein